MLSGPPFRSASQARPSFFFLAELLASRCQGSTHVLCSCFYSNLHLLSRRRRTAPHPAGTGAAPAARLTGSVFRISAAAALSASSSSSTFSPSPSPASGSGVAARRTADVAPKEQEVSCPSGDDRCCWQQPSRQLHSRFRSTSSSSYPRLRLRSPTPPTRTPSSR